MNTERIPQVHCIIAMSWYELVVFGCVCSCVHVFRCGYACMRVYVCDFD